MNTINYIRNRLGAEGFQSGTHRYKLDNNCSVAFRVGGLSPEGKTPVAVLMRDRRQTEGATAALFFEQKNDGSFSPFSFVLPQKGVSVNLYQTDSRGRVVGIDAAARPRLEELAANWDDELMNAFLIRRCISRRLHEIRPL